MTNGRYALIEYRIRMSLEELMNTDLSVTQIAYDSDFGSVSNYISSFRRISGNAPQSCRRGQGANLTVPAERSRPIIGERLFRVWPSGRALFMIPAGKVKTIAKLVFANHKNKFYENLKTELN